MNFCKLLRVEEKEGKRKTQNRKSLGKGSFKRFFLETKQKYTAPSQGHDPGHLLSAQRLQWSLKIELQYWDQQKTRPTGVLRSDHLLMPCCRPIIKRESTAFRITKAYWPRSYGCIKVTYRVIQMWLRELTFQLIFKIYFTCIRKKFTFYNKFCKFWKLYTVWYVPLEWRYGTTYWSPAVPLYSYVVSTSLHSQILATVYICFCL